MKDEIAKEWIERGRHDLDAAKILFAEQKHFDIILFHIHQAVEKYLKAFLICYGWNLRKIHDIETLITEALDFKSELKEYLDFSRELTAYYYEGRYPPGSTTPYSKEEVEKALETAEDIIKKAGKRNDVIQ